MLLLFTEHWPFSHGAGTLRCLRGGIGWRLVGTGLCPCGGARTVSRVVESCPLAELDGGLSRLRSADGGAVSWLTNCGK